MDKLDLESFEQLDRTAQKTTEEATTYVVVESLEPDLSEYWLDLDKESEPLEFLFTVGEGNQLLARGNVQTITGREKTGKSAYGLLLMVTQLKGEYLGVKPARPDMRVLWVDTEQDERTLREKALKVWEMAGVPRQDGRVYILTLKKAEIAKRLKLMLLAIEEVKPDFVFLDGVADLCLNFNDSLFEEVSRTCDESVTLIIEVCDSCKVISGCCSRWAEICALKAKLVSCHLHTFICSLIE